jgi:hypothetical protein
MSICEARFHARHARDERSRDEKQAPLGRRAVPFRAKHERLAFTRTLIGFG